MRLQVFGVNHKSAPIELRERISFPLKKLPQALKALKGRDSLRECLILSTCNRMEIYSAAADSRQDPCIQKFLSDFHKIEASLLNKHFYIYQGAQAAEHLFRVAASLDSMVVGETQILGQVKTAYSQARETGTVGHFLGRVFEEAIKTGKKVRNLTQIGKGAVSTSSAAIELTKGVFKNLKDKKVLIIGAGKIAELAVENLHSKGVQTVIVANRTFEKAKELAALFKGTAVRFDDILDYLADSDIVISSTSAPHFILKEKQVREAMRQRNHRPLLLIDLGLPRNIPQETGNIKDVHLYNLDDLSEVCEANLKERLSEAKKAENLIRAQLETFLQKWPAKERSL
ncbi:MAG TPA: glutamyl-tRNA reductase [Candidatus Omnitrophota bacterium]|nr:glutamyl-tRNA reductase [Candidatus Omnitrophota bacterium]